MTILTAFKTKLERYCIFFISCMSASWYHMYWVMTGSLNDFSEFICILLPSSSHPYCINYLMHVCFSYLTCMDRTMAYWLFIIFHPSSAFHILVPLSLTSGTFHVFCFLCTTHVLPFNYSDLILCYLYIHIFVVCISCSRHFCISCSLICVYCTVVCVFRVQD